MGKSEKIVIIGASGFGKEVAWLSEDCGFEVLGFLDDNTELKGKLHYGLPVLGTVDSWTDLKECCFVIGIGAPRVKKSIVDKMRSSGEPKFATLIHSSVLLSDTVSIGAGSVICAGSILTTDIELGEHVTINLNVSVGHDVKIGNFSTVAPKAAISGNVVLEDFVEVGTCAAIRQGLTLMRGSMLGMGSIITKNLNANMIAVGSPARPFKKLEDV